MKVYDEIKPLCLETDASGIRLRVGLLQTKEGMICLKRWGTWQQYAKYNYICKWEPISSGKIYSNIERKVLAMLHGVKKFHHYYFGPDLLIADWLSRQVNKDDKVPGMKINVSAKHMKIGIPNCMTAQEIQQANAKDDHQQQLRECIKMLARKQKWSTIRNVTLDIQRWYGSDWWNNTKSQMNSNGQRTTKQALNQIHSNHIRIEKVRLLAHMSICGIGISN